MSAGRLGTAAAVVFLFGSIPGCILGSRPSLVQVGSRQDQMTYYLDGAGNIGFGKETVPLGLSDGGYEGHVQHYIWTTYLGPLVDQVYLGHNRREGRRLAARIQQFLNDHPGGEVDLIGLSAGTGVIVFALEFLEPRHHVQNVIMLSSSLSADYDLSTALRRVDGGIYFFWSPDDPILGGFVPIIGTVDRSAHGTSPAGSWGARVPFGVSSQTRDLYGQKVHNVRWHPRPLVGPVTLRHAGSTSRSFIRDLVAPILVKNSRWAPGGRGEGASRPGRAAPTAAPPGAHAASQPAPRSP